MSAPISHPLLIVALCLIAGIAVRIALRQRRELAKVQGRVENLKFELDRMAHLPLNHPRRKTLVDEIMPAMRPVQDQLDRVLFPHHEAFDELDWMHKLKHRRFPYSITDEEGLILYNLLTRLGLSNGYEVATAFGYSSFYLGLAFKKNGGRLVSLDAYVEESQEHFVYDEATARSHAEAHIAARDAGKTEKLPEGLRFALAGASKLGLEETTRYEIGFSPMSIPSTLKDEIIDFAFIDGSHALPELKPLHHRVPRHALRSGRQGGLPCGRETGRGDPLHQHEEPSGRGHPKRRHKGDRGVPSDRGPSV